MKNTYKKTQKIFKILFIIVVDYSFHTKSLYERDKKWKFNKWPRDKNCYWENTSRYEKKSSIEIIIK